MANAPLGWAANTKIKDLCEIRSGYGFPLEFQGRTSGDLGFYKVGDISRAWQAGRFVLDRAEHYISHQDALTLRADVFAKGSVVFAKIGAAVALNRRAILGADALVDNNVMGLIATAATTPKFVFYFMCQVNLGARTRGGNVPSLRRGDVEEIGCPLPPLNEQRRIVAKIEELFSELDKGIENLKQARAQLAVYRQALLKHAFEGKLTAEWRGANPGELESADQIVIRIRAALESRYHQEVREWQEGTRSTKPRKPSDVSVLSPEEEASMAPLPPGWGWFKLRMCNVDIFDGPFGSNLKTSDYVGCGIRVVRLENIGVLEFIEEKESFITQEKYESLADHTVYPGDIVFSSFITERTRVAIVPKSVERAVNKADCFCVRCHGSALLNRFACLFLSTRAAFKQLEAVIHGVGRPRINTTQLKDVFVPICSPSEQTEVVNIVEEQLSLVREVEADIEANLQRCEALRQSILKKAFAGELVPQDPDDEPASALLTRIRAEREPKNEPKRAPRKLKKSPVATA